MVKVILCKGIPASGKSTWAKEEVFRGRGTWKRVNRDDIRAMIDGGVYSPSNEKLVLKIRDLVVQEAVKNGINVIIDDTNIKDKGKNFDEICAIVEALNINAQVIEKPFYIDVNEAVERDAKRPVPVGEKVVRTFFHEAGGKGFKIYRPKVETFLCGEKGDAKRIKKDPKLPDAIIVDLDGTLALLNGRNPYDASRCDETDLINKPVAETVKLYHAAGHKIIFCSGRIDQYRDATIRFIQQHLPDVEYQLFMRHTGDRRKDNLVKNEIFRKEIEGKYNISFVMDDRNQVVELWRSIGLPCFQVAPGNF